jgi:UDP-N-acetylglucosamine:LPS N-acetylglucosamine transferase
MQASKRHPKVKICLVTSSGGHLFKLFQLKDWWKRYPRFWVTRKDVFAADLLTDETVYLAHFPENRHLVNFFRNLVRAYQILKKEKPQLIFSLGAGVAPPFFLVARFLGIKTVFMETFILTPQPTLSGRLIAPFADLFLVQNKRLLKTYPKAKFWGGCL